MKFTLLISQKPQSKVGYYLYLKNEWIGIDPAFPDKCYLLSFATLWQSLWKHISFVVRNQKHLTLYPYFLAKLIKQERSYFLGFVLSITTLFPFFIYSQATLQHFYFVFNVSRFTLEYFERQFFQNVDFPEAGLPTNITIYFATKSVFPLSQIQPFQGTLHGLKPFTSILSTCPKNRFQGVLNYIPTLSANFKSESEKSLCFPSFLPAASPQKKLLDLSILIPPLFFYKHSHILVPGFLYQSSWAATKTCISTPISFAISLTLILICSALVCPF